MATEHDFRERIERGIADGDVPAGANAATIAAFYNAVNQGMAIQARDGADRSKLRLSPSRRSRRGLALSAPDSQS